MHRLVTVDRSYMRPRRTQTKARHNQLLNEAMVLLDDAIQKGAVRQRHTPLADQAVCRRAASGKVSHTLSSRPWLPTADGRQEDEMGRTISAVRSIVLASFIQIRSCRRRLRQGHNPCPEQASPSAGRVLIVFPRELQLPSLPMRKTESVAGCEWISSPSRTSTSCILATTRIRPLGSMANVGG